MIASYIDGFNRNTTRTLPLLDHINFWTLRTPSKAEVTWPCQVHLKYAYTDGFSPVYTRQIFHTKTLIVH